MNTEHIEKFVNAIACDLEEGGFRQVSGTTLRRSLTEAVASALPLLEAGIPVSRERAADRMRFRDSEFNRWLDEAITENGEFTVWDEIGDTGSAWHGWVSARDHFTATDVHEDLGLAEQQGVEGNGQSTEDNYQHFLSYSGLDGDELLRYAYYHGADVGLERPALATTGKQQVDPAWSLHDRVEFALRDAGFDLDEASRIALLADRQQVGEVQGDVRAMFEAWWKRESYNRGALNSWHGSGYNNVGVNAAWASWNSALAARQPGDK